METIEHTELGNALRLSHIENNPYLRVDAAGTVYMRLQRFGFQNLPEPMPLELSAGEVIAMAGDYFTQANWTMNLELPHCERFESTVELGKRLIAQPIQQKEETALITAYNNLAAPNVTRKIIDRIYAISNARYIPFSSALNTYVQTLMFFLRVKNYGEMLTRNQTHFTPWSVRVYVLGHTIALRYARLAFELNQLATNQHYMSGNPDLQEIRSLIANQPHAPSNDHLTDLAHRYQAQAYSMELFTFHYYTDHFATGHMSMVGDLRTELQVRFGLWGSILANNLHDEINRVGVYTNRPYDPTPNSTDAPIRSRGDGKMDTCMNQFNKSACLAGMTASVNDINNVFQGHDIPQQHEYGGLEYMPDVDFNIRQHQPLLVLSQGKVFYRKNLSQIEVISPSDYEALRANPLDHGYIELTSKGAALRLVMKLRLLPSYYKSKVLPLTEDKEMEILIDEGLRNPQRNPIPDLTCIPEAEHTVLDWPRSQNEMEAVEGVAQYGLFQTKPNKEAELSHKAQNTHHSLTN